MCKNKFVLFSIVYFELFIENLRCASAILCTPDPLTLQSQQSGGMGLISSRAPPLERHGKGSQTFN